MTDTATVRGEYPDRWNRGMSICDALECLELTRINPITV